MTLMRFWLIVLTTVILFLGAVVVYSAINAPQFGPNIWNEKQDYAGEPLSTEDQEAIKNLPNGE